MTVYTPSGGGTSFPLANVAPTPATVEYQTSVTGDTNPRFQLRADGGELWGSGSAPPFAEILPDTTGGGEIMFYVGGNLAGSGYGFYLRQSGVTYLLGNINNNGGWQIVAGPAAGTNLGFTITADVYPFPAVMANASTNGFFWLRTCAGPPTGVPVVPAGSGIVPMIYDTTTHKFWIYDAGWKGIVLT